MFSSSTIRLTATAVFLSMLTGCTYMQTLPSTRPADVETNIGIGDRVEIQRLSGDRIKMTVDEKLPTGLKGSGRFVTYADMAYIKVRRVDGTKTATAIETGVNVVLIVAGIYALQGLSATARPN